MLPNGKALVVGGEVANQTLVPAAELFDPATLTWTTNGAGVLNSPRYDHAATLLPNGTVVVAEGYPNFGAAGGIFDPTTATFSQSMLAPGSRAAHPAAGFKAGGPPGGVTSVVRYNAPLPPHSASVAGDSQIKGPPKYWPVRAWPARFLKSDLRPLVWQAAAWPLDSQWQASGRLNTFPIKPTTGLPLANHSRAFPVPQTPPGDPVTVHIGTLAGDDAAEQAAPSPRREGN